MKEDKNNIIDKINMTDDSDKIVDKVIDKIAEKGSDAVGSFAGKAAGAMVSTAIVPLILKIVLGIVLIGGLGFGLVKAFKPKPLTIDKTANVIEQIRKIGEFTTLCYYEELVICEKRVDTTGRIFGSFITKENELVLIGKGLIRAGFDFKKISENDMIVHGDTLDLFLPKAEIFDIIMNPSDFATEYEEGVWGHYATTQLKVDAKKQLVENAQKYGLLEKAEENGKKRVKNIFKVFGINTVNIIIKE